MLFKSGEYRVFCFIYDMALGACDGVEDVSVQYGEVLRSRAGGGGVLVPDDRQLLRVALVWRGGASNICGEGAHQDILEVPGRPGGPRTFL